MRTEMTFMIALAVAILLSAFPAEAETQRSTAQINKFKRAYPCPAPDLPADHKVTGPCPGFVVDHQIALCAGGADLSSNMAWSTKDESLLKDREEKQLCALIRAGRLPLYDPQPRICVALAPDQFPLLRGFMCPVAPP